MTREQLEAIRNRANVATEGPWYTASTTDGPWIIEENGNIISGTCAKVSDGGFIAHAREDVPALLAEVERLQKALDAVTPPTNPNKRPCVARNITLGGKRNANEEIR